MRKFGAGVLFAVGACALLQLIGGSPKTALADPVIERPALWIITAKALCHPVAACKPKLCTGQGTGSCDNEVTPIPDVQNQECGAVPEWYKTCSILKGNKTPCATITAVCVVITLMDVNGQHYEKCEAAAATNPPDPLVGTAAGNANECSDFSLF